LFDFSCIVLALFYLLFDFCDFSSNLQNSLEKRSCLLYQFNPARQVMQMDDAGVVHLDGKTKITKAAIMMPVRVKLAINTKPKKAEIELV
jgi:hypothetical protein